MVVCKEHVAVMRIDVPCALMSGQGEDRAGVAAARADVLTALKGAGSAEEFFALLDVAYDPKLLNVARLHILKRMGDYLNDERLDEVPADIAAARCKAVLERAYADFTASSPLKERVFKVLKAEDPEAKPFVPLDTLLK